MFVKAFHYWLYIPSYVCVRKTSFSHFKSNIPCLPNIIFDKPCHFHFAPLHLSLFLFPIIPRGRPFPLPSISSRLFKFIRLIPTQNDTATAAKFLSTDPIPSSYQSYNLVSMLTPPFPPVTSSAL